MLLLQADGETQTNWKLCVFQDKAKMELRQKLSTPPEADEIRQMVAYARNVIEEFRRAKHYKNILHWPFQ